MISLLFCGNRKAFDGILITSLSLLKETVEPVTAYVMTMDLTAQNPDFQPLTQRETDFLDGIYRQANPENHVVLLDAGEYYRKTLLSSPNAQTEYTPYTFLRLFAHLFPALPDTVLYLDADLIVSGDLSPLYHKPLGDAEFAGVLDYYGRWFLRYDYINAGVLLLNLKRIRETGLFDRAVAACAEKKLFLPDQTALNRLATKKLFLSGRYNDQKRTHRDTVIRHFSKTILWFPWFHTRNIKPWEPEKIHQVLRLHCYDAVLNRYQYEKTRYLSGTKA